MFLGTKRATLPHPSEPPQAQTGRRHPTVLLGWNHPYEAVQGEAPEKSRRDPPQAGDRDFYGGP